MRVLFVTNELPHFTGGGQPIRDYNLMANLAGRYQFTVVCFADADAREGANKVAGLRKFCEQVLTVPRPRDPAGTWPSRLATLEQMLRPLPGSVRALTPPSLRTQVQQLLREERFSIIHVNHVEMGSLLAAAGRARRVLGTEVLAPKIERLLRIEPRPARRVAYYLEWRKMVRYERALFPQVDLCTMASAAEEQAVLVVAPQARVAVIGNGVDIPFFTPPDDRKRQREDSLLFVGSLAYPPNHDAVLFFHQHVWPLLKQQLPRLVWRIVGRDPSPDIQALAAPDVEVTGLVPDIRPYLWASQVLVVPLRGGGGTRLKILEAMAADLPVVSTRIGAEGLDVSDGHDILLADTPEHLAAAIARLLQKPDLVSTIQTHGRRLVESHYDWQHIAQQLDTTYQSLFGEAAPCPASA